MKSIACFATYKPRAHTRKFMLDSIEGMFDKVMMFDNDTFEFDRKDNAKFMGLDVIDDPCYIHLLDDDLVYPPDYRKVTEEAIDTYGCIITHHGRRLLGEGKPYYKGHEGYRCLDQVDVELEIDVCGTGVTSFRTDYFHPKGLANCPLQRMSDLIFSLRAAQEEKRIGIIPHSEGWIRHIENPEQIYTTEKDRGTPIQNYLADEIFRLRYK